MEVKLDLTREEMEVVLEALAGEPYRKVASIIPKVHNAFSEALAPAVKEVVE